MDIRARLCGYFDYRDAMVLFLGLDFHPFYETLIRIDSVTSKSMLTECRFFIFVAYCTSSRLHYSLSLITKEGYFLSGRIAAGSFFFFGKMFHHPSLNFALRTKFDSHQHLSSRLSEFA